MPQASVETSVPKEPSIENEPLIVQPIQPPEATTPTNSTEEGPPIEEAMPESEMNEAETGEFIAPPLQTQEESTTEGLPPQLSHATLQKALETELSRDQETSLLLIECEFSGTMDASALALSTTIRDYFASDMLVFELARGCYAAILPGIDAGEAMRLAVDSR